MAPQLTLSDLLVVLGGFSFICVLYSTRGKRRSSYLYPPGPTRLPILGNLHQFPTHDEWVTYDKWCKEIGSDIIYLRAAGMEFVVLNSLEAITDLLQKRSSIYSSRPKFPMACDLMGWTWMLLGIEYGQTWKEQRRIFTRYFHSKNPSVYQPKHIAFVRGMLPGLLNTPEDFFEITKHAVHGSAISMAYGLPVQQRDDPYVDLAERSTNSLNRAVLPGNFLVNIIPALRYVPEFFPGAGFKRKAKAWRQLQVDFRSKPFEKTVTDMRRGKM